MKRLLCLLLSLFLFGGCSNIGAAELGDRLIIEAIGIDSSENGFEITVLTLNTQQSGSANSTDTPDGVAKTFSAKAETLAAAFAEIDLVSGQYPLYSQARVIILGKELAENAPIAALNYFIREYTTRDDILLAVASGHAKEIISVDFGDNVLASKTIHSVLQSGEINGMTVTMPLYRFVSNLLNETDTAFLPILQVRKDTNSKDDSLRVVGTALFAKERWTATLNEEQTKGLLIASDRFDSGPLDLCYNANSISLAVQRCKTKIKLLDGERPQFLITITFSCDVIEYNTPSHRELDMETVKDLRSLAEEKVKRSIENTINKAVRENSCDILSFGRMLHKKQPVIYKQAVADYSNFLKNVPITVQVEAKITRTGKEILPFD